MCQDPMCFHFKIIGQIEEWGQKDKLSYNNLMHQIDVGVNKGHRESEIINAVMSLHDMLEIKTDLTLSQLRTFSCCSRTGWRGIVQS